MGLHQTKKKKPKIFCTRNETDKKEKQYSKWTRCLEMISDKRLIGKLYK